MMDAKTATNGRLLLALLMLIYAINQLDRNILGIALPGIRAEFHLGDSALGLLAGPAFALVYVLLGIPMAVLADRGHARAIIAGSLAAFSAMTMLCGMAGNFAQLLAARTGVGLGEAGSAPALNAMIAMRFPPEKRGGALSIYSAGANLGLLLAFFGGGLIMQHWGWRAALMAAGVSGFLLMLLFLAWREPVPAVTAPRTPLGRTVRFLWRHKGFRLLALGSGLASIGGYAALAFVPSFLLRSHHLTAAQAGMLLALLVGVGGFFGTMLPGLAADRLRKNDGLGMAMAVIFTWIPAHLLLCLAGGLSLMSVGLALAAFLVSSWLGPVLAAAQTIAPDGMRAQTAALLLAILNLIGMAMGPLLVGIASDLLQPALGEDALRYALACAAAPAPLAICCLAGARRRIAQVSP